MTYKAFSAAPDAAKYPHVARWYKHIASYEGEFSTLPGDASKAFTAYGPESTELPVNPKDKPEDEEEEDLFGSDSEEEDPAVVAERNKRLEEYKAKKAAKPKPVAKSLVTLEVKPWGMLYHESFSLVHRMLTLTLQMTRPTLRSSRPTSVPSRWMVWSGVLPNSSPSASVSRSSRLTWSLRTTRCPPMSSSSGSRRTRTTSSPPTLLPCRSCDLRCPFMKKKWRDDGNLMS